MRLITRLGLGDWKDSGAMFGAGVTTSLWGTQWVPVLLTPSYLQGLLPAELRTHSSFEGQELPCIGFNVWYGQIS